MANKHKQKGMRGEYEVRDLLQVEIDSVFVKWITENPIYMSPNDIPVLSRNLEQVRAGRLSVDKGGVVGGKVGGEGDGMDVGGRKVGRGVGGRDWNADFRGSGSDLVGLDWLAVEVKRQENDGNFTGWWEQCKAAALPFGQEPVLIHRKNHCAWEVRMYGWLMPIGRDGRRIGEQSVKCPVDINLGSFLAYFRMRLEAELDTLKDGNGSERVKMASATTNSPEILSISEGSTPDSAHISAKHSLVQKDLWRKEDVRERDLKEQKQTPPSPERSPAKAAPRKPWET